MRTQLIHDLMDSQGCFHKLVRIDQLDRVPGCMGGPGEDLGQGIRGKGAGGDSVLKEDAVIPLKPGFALQDTRSPANGRTDNPVDAIGAVVKRNSGLSFTISYIVEIDGQNDIREAPAFCFSSAAKLWR